MWIRVVSCDRVASRPAGRDTPTRDGKSSEVRVASDCHRSRCNAAPICQPDGGTGYFGARSATATQLGDTTGSRMCGRCGVRWKPERVSSPLPTTAEMEETLRDS